MESGMAKGRGHDVTTAQFPKAPTFSGAVLNTKKKQPPASGTLDPPQSASRRVTAVSHRSTGVA